MRSSSTRTVSARAFLDSARIARHIVTYRRAESIFSQGDPGNSVLYIRKGAVKLSVQSSTGREAVVAMRGPGDFFGEACLAGQRVRRGSATAITLSTILVLEKNRMVRLLNSHPGLADRFIAHMLGANNRMEEDLIDQFFNHEEKRVARALLSLARYGKQDKPRRVLPAVSAQTLARMAGTTQSTIAFFMKKFKRLRFIEEGGRLTINRSLLSVVLRD